MRFKYRHGGTAGLLKAAAAITAFIGALTPALCQIPVNTISKAPDITKVPTLYEVGYSHLDTEWCWMYPQVIDEFIGNTLHQNFALFDKYPDYVFNWTGANRYRYMKEYYPVEYAKVKTYVAAGRWVNTGSSLEEGDVNVPSEESIIRQVMYGNEFFNKEFHSSSSDFILPDCFGFPASLPSILAHCGLNGFATQKLTWGSGERTMGVNGIPFDLGVWVGPDNQGVFAALNAGDYNAPLRGDVSNNANWLSRLNADGASTGIYAIYNYYGVGDRGGSVRDSDAANLETSLHSGGPVHVVSARSDQVFNDLEKVDTSKLLRYKGDLLLTQHSAGSPTSQVEMKRWNHENEKIADATERASVAADWLGALPYDKDRITDAWWKFLPGQFHDLLAGTALPMAYEYAWNDEVLALNEFAGQLQEAVGGVSRGLNTSGSGIPIVVYNPISTQRQDDVTANVKFPGAAPTSVDVTGPNGESVPSQIESRTGSSVKVLFLATVPSVSYTTFFVKPAAQTPTASELKVSKSGLENARYKVTLNNGGDITSIYDKKAGKELLSAPLRLSFQYENPSQFPAWNMDWADQSKAPEGYVDGPAKITVTEEGPVRVGLTVDRWARDSHFVETIRLSAGQAGNRLEFFDNIDWQTLAAALKVYMPLSVSNPLATYNWELGTVQRSNNNPLKYEDPSHQWFDVTDTSGKYGVSILTGDRYSSDKPTDNLVRLTLLYTPGVRAGYVHQKTSDWGHHELTYAISGHTGDWVAGNTQWSSIGFDRPLIAFQAPAHAGSLGSSFSFVSVSNRNVSVEALKQAEASHAIIVRFNELAGRPEKNIIAKFAGAIASAKEVNGQEAPIGPATIKNGALVFDMSSYRPRAFEVTLATAPIRLTAPTSKTVELAYNVNVTKPFGSASGGSFDAAGNAIPGDMLPTSIVSDGVKFSLASSDAAKNAVQAHGQKIALPATSASKLYIIAASSDGDVDETFHFGGHQQVIKVQAWNGKIGQWDDRVWGGEIPVLTYNMTNPLIGLNPGYIKRDTVAWYADHIRGADGTNETYKYCYLYRYALDIPAGASSVTLPNDSRLKILAATIAVDPNGAAVPAQPLYDTLEHSSDSAPRIDYASAADGASTKVTIETPLYFQQSSSLHYTLDGSAPTVSSAVYVAPLMLSQSAKVRAAYINQSGSIQGTAEAVASVQNPTGPKVTGVSSMKSSAVMLTFSEPVSKETAENAANYSLTPADAVSSAVLSGDGTTVTLNLTSPRAEGQQSTLSVTGIKSNLPDGLAVSGADNLPIPQPNVAFVKDQVVTYDGSGSGESKDVPGLPTSAGSPWTINLYAYFDSTPDDMTTLAGFGDDSDTTGAERYIAKFSDGIHFWGSNIDISNNVPFDVGKWQMVTATFDGTTVRLYKNAELIASQDVTLTDAASVVKVGPLGPWGTTSGLKGKIAGLRIYSSALTQAQISDLLANKPAN